MTAYETTTARLLQQELGACALIQDLLPLYVEGEVSPGSRDLIVEHVARCDRCAGYLAGTQNVLTLLRRDRTIHVATLERDTPNRQTLTARQRLVTAIAVLTTYGGGLIASVALANLMLDGPDAAAFFVGLVLGLASLGSLLALARSRSPLTLQRVIALLGSCAVATFGSFVMVESHGEPLPVLILWALGLVGVWVTVGLGVSDREPAS
jgi:predicted anti-sigma-YlaC factor YlaD